MNGNAVQGWFTGGSLVRRTAETVLRAVGRRHLARLDRLAAARCQTRILLGLVHQAQATRFGRDHDFRRIRTVADYRRLVPLSDRAQLWRDYWQPVYPHLAGATWPEMQNAECRMQNEKQFFHSAFCILHSALVSLSAAHRSAMRTALALAAHGRPRTRLLSGSWLLVADEGPSNRMRPAILAERLPTLLRPYTELSTEIPVERLARLPVNGLIGPAERLLPLLEKIKQERGKSRLCDVWPNLSTILYTRRPPMSAAAALHAEAGEEVLLLEMTGRAEGPITVEDPRHGSARLLFDHGVYFEFVPLDRADEPRCPRYGIDEIECDVPYELAVTSPAGLWSCRLGRTVCLQHRDPPLLRFVETAIQQPVGAAAPRRARRTDLVLSTPPLPAPHPQNAGSPAAPPENSFHIPWSVHADRE